MEDINQIMSIEGVNTNENSVDPKHVRFSELMWYDPNHDIIVGGVGGIGSWLAMLLGRAGYKLFLFDDDVIDETNMAGQLYKVSDIGKYKGAAVQEAIYAYSNNPDVTVMCRYEADSEYCPIMFSCFDNMEARKLLFENWAAGEDRSVFIDGRMLAESFQIFAVTPGNNIKLKMNIREVAFKTTFETPLLTFNLEL